MKSKEEFMRAIALAKESAKQGDYPIGAIIVKGNKIIATGKTMIKTKNDPTLRTEIDAIRKACKRMRSHYLEGCTLYSTCEPCTMSTSAAIWAKMGGIVFGVFGKDARKRKSDKFSWRQIDIPAREIVRKGTPRLELYEGFLKKECIKLFDFTKTKKRES
jgi:tRNA(Arg) A34 adenosine deaminase TadA